jgi:iron complex transport system substrate-binding protein
MNIRYVLLGICCILLGCRDQPAQKSGLDPGEVTSIWKPMYASGFSAEHTRSGVVFLKVHNPWPGASRTFTYALVPREQLGNFALNKDSLDGVIPVPAARIILTSTTHIPSMESLGMEDRIVGFPGLDLISSPKTRKRLEAGEIRELGANEQLNTELVLSLQPDLVIGFGVNGAPGAYATLEGSGIPVVYNGDWMEEDPLGKAEWIQFFGLLLGKEAEASDAFQNVETAYQEARSLAATARTTPTVLSGALYRDVWYLPGGGSWAARFIKDANARYLWEDTPQAGSLSLSLETVLEKGSLADFWISPSQYTSYEEMARANVHYEQFRAFSDRKVFTYAATRGPGVGLLYFEEGPGRPDLILKDLIYWLHPGLLEDYKPVFFKPLK